MILSITIISQPIRARYDEASGQRDEEGGRLVANLDSNGRYHSDWLSMIYPRLKLARNLLCDDGAIFISIDENEQANLKRLCDEIFGESNFLVNFSWRTDGNFDNQAKFKKCHEYILAYAKNELEFKAPPVIDPNVPKSSKLYKAEVRNTIVKNGPKNPLGKVTLPKSFPADMANGVVKARTDSWPHYFNDAVIEKNLLVSEIEIESGWSSKDLLLSFISNNCKPVEDNKGQKSRFVISTSGAIEVIKERGSEQSHVISSLQNLGGPQKAVAEIQSINVIFDDYPKPVALIKYLCQMVRNDDGLVLDFFAGSATTAHAVMQLNAEDGGNRSCISVQLPEQVSEKSEAFKAGYKNIAEISKERIRRAGKKIKEDNADKDGIEKLDIGFRVFKIDSSNMVDVHLSPDEAHPDMFD
ncbi:MAG: DNA methyltransferase, partial [Enterobacterales bacterium]|nr:DNA methyltransferase [Enterobacterales bacterium]